MQGYKETSKESYCNNPGKRGRCVGQSGQDGYSEKSPDSGYIWEVEPTEFAGILFMGCEKEEPRKSPAYLA